MLLIIHCEEKSEEERKNIMEEFFQQSNVVKYGLRGFFQLGVFFTDCLRPQLEHFPNLMATRNQAEMTWFPHFTRRSI